MRPPRVILGMETEIRGDYLASQIILNRMQLMEHMGPSEKIDRAFKTLQHAHTSLMFKYSLGWLAENETAGNRR